MKNKNICQIINDTDLERLRARNFVLEGNREVMERTLELQHNCVYLVISGKCSFVFDGRSFAQRTGGIVFGFSGERVTANGIEDGTEYMYVSFDGGRADELFRRFGITRSNRSFFGLEALIPFWKENIARAADAPDLVSESVLLYTFSRLKGSKKQSDDIISKTLRVIEYDFTDPELSLTSVADRLGYNEKYISRSFKEKMGVGFSQYLRTVRIKHAVFLIEHGVNSVKNIAFLCGFTDPLYFSSVFKDTIGVSPKEYMSKKTAPGV